MKKKCTERIELKMTRKNAKQKKEEKIKIPRKIVVQFQQ